MFQALLKKHEALMADIDAYGTTIAGLDDASHQCKVRIFDEYGRDTKTCLNNHFLCVFSRELVKHQVNQLPLGKSM